jgi:hypothetical protein
MCPETSAHHPLITLGPIVIAGGDGEKSAGISGMSLPGAAAKLYRSLGFVDWKIRWAQGLHPSLLWYPAS